MIAVVADVVLERFGFVDCMCLVIHESTMEMAVSDTALKHAI